MFDQICSNTYTNMLHMKTTLHIYTTFCTISLPILCMYMRANTSLYTCVLSINQCSTKFQLHSLFHPDSSATDPLILQAQYKAVYVCGRLVWPLLAKQPLLGSSYKKSRQQNCNKISKTLLSTSINNFGPTVTLELTKQHSNYILPKFSYNFTIYHRCAYSIKTL